jgi:HK97 family phage prohead protease
MTILRTCRPFTVRADADAEAADPRLVRVTVSTETMGRDGIVLRSTGMDLSAYRNNPIVLWQHNADWPIGRAEAIGVEGTDVVASVRFAPAGVSDIADRVLGLIRSKVVNAASTGFETRQAEPLDPAKPRDGVVITECELQEFSFVSIPAVPDALVLQRAFTDRAIVLRETAPAANPDRDRMKGLLVKRGLYDCGALAYLLSELGWTHDSAKWETEFEGDNSKVPGMLADGIKLLADALLAMTAEEVAEFLAGHDVNIEPTAEESVVIEQSASPAVKRFRLGLIRARGALALPAPPSPKPMSQHRRMAELYRRELGAAA